MIEEESFERERANGVLIVSVWKLIGLQTRGSGPRNSTAIGQF